MLLEALDLTNPNDVPSTGLQVAWQVSPNTTFKQNLYYGPELTAHLVRNWLAALEVGTLFIEPGSPWENGYVESFNGKLRDELLAREIFYTLHEAQVLIERWRVEYNTIRP